MNKKLFKTVLMYTSFTFSGLTFGYALYSDLKDKELVYALCTGIGTNLTGIAMLIDLKQRNANLNNPN
ncbi:hypothetical protein GGR92_001535 [Spirosoma lacussanchae]|uniref:hypothetical protein n=1 Tax=Spirosoma lacussanchae TaxID=1884249 RepID=UPI0011081DBF|nr:hypothetical protein [Spirosoma lacussanchae]